MYLRSKSQHVRARGWQFAAVLFAAFFTQTAAADTVKYYRNMVFRESPVEDIRGRQEIDAATAQQVIHFRFHYDDQNRLTEVSHRVGDKLTENDGSFPGFFWWAPKVDISYVDGKEIRHFYNVANERTGAHGKVYRMEFTLDESKRRSRLNYFDKDGKPVDGDWGIHEYRWSYPQAGAIIEERSNVAGAPATMRPDFKFNTIRMEFGDDDWLDFVFNIDSNGDLTENETGAAVDRIVYDLHGNFIRWQVYDKKRLPKNGNYPLVAMGEYTYDQLGNSMMLRGYGEQGENRLFSWGGNQPFAYDQRGNITSIGTLGLDGKLVREERLEYSDDGSRLEWIKYYDGDGKPDPKQPYFALKLIYSDKGLRLGARPHDAQLKPVPPPKGPAKH
jgi:hypothetical protein